MLDNATPKKSLRYKNTIQGTKIAFLRDFFISNNQQLVDNFV